MVPFSFPIRRWSAAKGVGRVTGRLPKELADDVVTSVLELFSLRESDSAWHGGCLALAELGRRGLILPQHLERVVGVVLRALVYDEQRGNFSVGAHIRDAACYVCWSFARAYDPPVLEPHVRGIAGALLVAAVFDREVTCRRAASAAFQENVGRQGTFPHGIEILTETDYYAVGSRTNAFLNLSVHIAQFPEYTLALVEHLLRHKINHWDPAVRELAAKSLHNLTPSDPDYAAAQAVPLLLDLATGVDPNARHGALLALGEVVHALALLGPVEDVLGAEVSGRIAGLVSVLDERGLFRGMGGVQMRTAACLLVEKCSLAALPLPPGEDIPAKWQRLLDGCLRHADGGVRASAVSALPHFLGRHLRPGDRILDRYLEGLGEEHMESRCGFALAIGALPASVLAGRVEEAVRALGRCVEDTEEHPEWADARRDAVRALAGVARTVGTGGLGDPGPLFEALLAATRDYTLDSRGEIGAIVREAAMLAIQEVVLLVKEVEEDLVSRIFCVLVQQCTEKIDRTRAVAGGVFRTLLHSQPPIPGIPHREELLEVFPEETCRDLNWASPGDTFRLFVRLLHLPRYTPHLLMGFVVSVGGLTESLVKYSSSALVGHLSSRRSDDAFLQHLCDALLRVLEENLSNDRVVVPFFKMMNHLLPSGAELPGPAFHERLLALAWEASRKSRDPQKIVAAVDLLCNLLPFSEGCRRGALNRLAVFLCHRFPRVRKVTAGKLYEALVTYDLAEDERATEILSETDWGATVEALRPARDRLCGALGLQPPVPRAK
ncbi:tubulin-specific chaperone D-like [Uloborus diversus]|uniref:tubulin-specific chaperone D-like n=1 Tax=Uloborus diversus TaxID=327109 RepID=UPI002409FFB2|nr:tubulin-specific chaperone D-like [Uloborus diversus]